MNVLLYIIFYHFILSELLYIFIVYLFLLTSPLLLHLQMLVSNHTNVKRMNHTKILIYMKENTI